MRVRAPVSANVIRQSAMSRAQQVLDLAPRAEHEVVGHRLVVAQEVVLDHVRPVAEAEHEVLVAVVGVVAHHVPQDRPVPDRVIGLGRTSLLSRRRRPWPPQNRTTFMPLGAPRRGSLDDLDAPGSGRRGGCRPRAAARAGPRSRAAGSTAGSRRRRAGRRRGASGGRIGMRVPGVNRPCLYGLRSTVNEIRSGPIAAVVEQRVGLARRTVARDRPAARLARRPGTPAASRLVARDALGERAGARSTVV